MQRFLTTKVIDCHLMHLNAVHSKWYNQTDLIYGTMSQDYIATKIGEYYLIVTLAGYRSNYSNSLNVVITSHEKVGNEVL